MADTEKIRSKDVRNPIKEEFEKGFYAFGKSLRTGMHNRGFLHGYPHIEQVSLRGDRCRFHDLYSVKDKSRLSPHQILGYQLFDVWHVLNSIDYVVGEKEKHLYIIF